MRIGIPKKIKIGRKTYTVEVVNVLPRCHNGEIDYVDNTIKLLSAGKNEMREVFIHEVIHAILQDMRRHDLNNEAFVKAFCKRLYQVLKEV